MNPEDLKKLSEDTPDTSSPNNEVEADISGELTVEEQNKQAEQLVDFAKMTKSDAENYLLSQGVPQEQIDEILEEEENDLEMLSRELDELRKENDLIEMSVEIRLRAEDYMDRKLDTKNETTINSYYETIWQIARTKDIGMSELGIESSCLIAAVTNEPNPNLSLEDQAILMNKVIGIVSRLKSKEQSGSDSLVYEVDDMVTRVAEKIQNMGVFEEEEPQDRELI